MDYSVNWTKEDKNGNPQKTGETSTVSYVLMENNFGERICKVSEPIDLNYICKFYNDPYHYGKLTEDKKIAHKSHDIYKKTIFPWLHGAKLNEPWASNAKDREKELRQKHPGLEELWEKYQAFLILCKEDKDFEED